MNTNKYLGLMHCDYFEGYILYEYIVKYDRGGHEFSFFFFLSPDVDLPFFIDSV